MFRVMIVEDEPLMRQGLIHKIDWSKVGLELAGEAADGVEALERLPQLAPEIVVVDIRMPGLDGLELIRLAKERQPELEFVIVSGYKDFEYAQEALKHGAAGYVLKPVDAGELNRILCGISVRLLKRKEERERWASLARGMERNREDIRDLQLTRMVCEGDGANRLPQLWTDAASPGPYAVVVCDVEPFTLPHRGFRQQDEALVWFALRNILEWSLAAEGVSGIVFRHASARRQMVVLVRCTDQDPHSPFAWVKGALAGIRETLGLETTAGIGLIADTRDSLAASFTAAALAARTRALRGPGHVYDSRLLRQKAPQLHTVIPDESETRLVFTCLQEHRSGELRDWLEHKFRQLAGQEGAGYAHLERLALEIHSLFRRYLLKLGAETDVRLGEVEDFRRTAREFACWEDAVRELYGDALRIMGGLAGAGRKRETGDEIVAEVKRYIDANYFRDISLGWVAETYYIHPNYFSKRFKETWGESFSDYLTKVRMQHAVRLLAKPALKIQEVAALVGYDDSAYFSSVFRKYYNIPPSKFREGLHA